MTADASGWYSGSAGSALVLNGERSTGVGLDGFEQAATDAVEQVMSGFALTSGTQYHSNPGGCVTHRYAKLKRDADEIIVSTWRVESAADPHWVPNESTFHAVDNSTLVSSGEHIGVVLAVAPDGTTARVTVYGAGASERVAGWPTTVAPPPDAPELGAVALTTDALIPVARAVLTFVLSQRGDIRCEPTLTHANPILGAEVEAVSSTDIEVWALIFNTWPLHAGDPLRVPVDEEVKIVWRATGDGDVSVDAVGPSGETLTPEWGPEIHGSSNWDRAGDEWGTGWTFPETGCWSLRLQRGDASATLNADVFA
jgi:hypothetical protein